MPTEYLSRSKFIWVRVSPHLLSSYFCCHYNVIAPTFFLSALITPPQTFFYILVPRFPLDVGGVFLPLSASTPSRISNNRSVTPFPFPVFSTSTKQHRLALHKHPQCTDQSPSPTRRKQIIQGRRHRPMGGRSNQSSSLHNFLGECCIVPPPSLQPAVNLSQPLQRPSSSSNPNHLPPSHPPLIPALVISLQMAYNP